VGGVGHEHPLGADQPFELDRAGVEDLGQGARLRRAGRDRRAGGEVPWPSRLAVAWSWRKGRTTERVSCTTTMKVTPRANSATPASDSQRRRMRASTKDDG